MDMPRKYKLSWILNGNDPHSTDPSMEVVPIEGLPYWIPARGYEMPNLKLRIALAWQVFTGRLDAIDSRH